MSNQAESIKVVDNNEVKVDGNVQEVYIKALGTGVYDNPEITVKKNIPVRLHFTAEQQAGCGKMLVMRNFGVKLVSANGEEKTAVFTPSSEGVYEYSCAMRMFRGSMKVIS